MSDPVFTREVLRAVLVGLIAGLSALLVIQIWERTRRRRRGLPVPDTLMMELRNRVLRATPGQFSIAPRGSVWGVVMEQVARDQVTSMVALADGNTSLYLSGGGGVIGGGGRADIAAAALKCCDAADAIAPELDVARDFPFPRPRRIRFFALTTGGVRTAEVEEKLLASGDHRCSPLFAAGREVMTRLRKVEAQTDSDAS